ncbi:hypothetical protein L1887_03313 [Cichorium endivia]|nr:hypothetical protein L1887_03313 [Cichorium endivia]
MNYGSIFKNTHLKSTAKHTFHFVLLVAVGLWLLYQIRESYTKVSINGESFSIHHKNERISNILGRKGHVTPLKSTHQVDSNVTLDNIMNPGQLSNVKEREAIATQVLTKMRSDHEVNESEDGGYRYLDENGIPEIVREKLVGNESTQPGNETKF